MKNIFSLILGIWLTVTSQGVGQIIETHEFGALNTQWYIYSDGRTWKFAAHNTMIVKYVEVKSVLASAIYGTFHIELNIKDSLIAKWDQQVGSRYYQPYVHSKEVTYSLTQGDTIKYKIYGNQFWTAEGGLLGINYVKLADRVVTDVKTSGVEFADFILFQNYPNPFNPLTKIRYSLPHGGFVSLKVFDVLGKEIATLVNNFQNAGSYELEFNGAGLSSGVYIYRLSSGSYSDYKKMILIE